MILTEFTAVCELCVSGTHLAPYILFHKARLFLTAPSVAVHTWNSAYVQTHTHTHTCTPRQSMRLQAGMGIMSMNHMLSKASGLESGPLSWQQARDQAVGTGNVNTQSPW